MKDINHQRLNEITEQVIGMCIDIHKETGPGLLEAVYEECLCILLRESNIPFTRQGEIPALFRGRKIGIGFRYDILIDNVILVELKSVEHILPIHKAQVITYIRLIPVPIGLLINFHCNKLIQGVHRLIHPEIAPQFPS